MNNTIALEIATAAAGSALTDAAAAVNAQAQPQPQPRAQAQTQVQASSHDNEHSSMSSGTASRLLSPEEKRLHHLQSEQRRRQQLKGALDVLDQIVPISSTDRKSINTEATVINRAIQYIKMLMNERATLESHLAIKNQHQQHYARHAPPQALSNPASMSMNMNVNVGYHPMHASAAHGHAQAHAHTHPHPHLHAHAHAPAQAHAQQTQAYTFPYTH